MAAPLILLLLPLAAAQAQGGSARSQGPVCAPVLRVAESTPDCPSNGIFVREAKNCLRRIEEMEAGFGAQAISVANAGRGGQAGENGTGRNEYLFSSAALASLAKAATEAEDDLMAYHAYVVPPPLSSGSGGSELFLEPLDWSEGPGCFRDAHEQLRTVEEAIRAKHERFDARLKEALAYEKKLKANGVSYQSLLGPAATGRDTRRLPASPPRGRSARPGSDVTGVAEDLAKEKRNTGSYKR